MNLEILPVRLAGAAENMAIDFLLLQRYPRAGSARFRHYGWRAPAYTFGFSQKIAFVRSQISSEEVPELCRRPTGGGLVDHRQDWTYALVIPRGHRWEEQRALQSYRAIHAALAAALIVQGVPAEIQAVAPADDLSVGPSVCFQRAELYDVVHALSGEKIAGAAQKRNKNGLLFQGSIGRAAAGSAVDWELFHGDFCARLATALETEAAPTPWPEFHEDEVSGLVEQYASSDWIDYR